MKNTFQDKARPMETRKPLRVIDAIPTIQFKGIKEGNQELVEFLKSSIPLGTAVQQTIKKNVHKIAYISRLFEGNSEDEVADLTNQCLYNTVSKLHAENLLIPGHMAIGTLELGQHETHKFPVRQLAFAWVFLKDVVYNDINLLNDFLASKGVYMRAYPLGKIAESNIFTNEEI